MACTRDTRSEPAAILAANLVSCFTTAFSGAVWSRWLSELVASGLLTSALFAQMRDADDTD